jgi:hypothetical protein
MITVFCGLTPCSLLTNVLEKRNGPICIVNSSTLMKEVVRFSETWPHIAGDSDLYSHCHDGLKSR